MRAILKHRRLWTGAGGVLGVVLVMFAARSAVDGYHTIVRNLLLYQFDHASYFFEQFEAAQRIVALHDRRVLPPLAHWLTAEDRHARGNAAFVFASLGDARGFDVIVAILNDRSWRPKQPGGPGGGISASANDPPPYNLAAQIADDRYYAAHLLGDLKDPKAVPILIALLTDRDVQDIVPWSLGQIGDARAVAPLIQTLADKDPDMRVLAIYGLEELHGREAIPALYPLLHDHEKTHFDKLIPVSEAAREALAKLSAD